MDIRAAIAHAVARQSLTDVQMEAVMRQLMAGDATPAQIGGWLIALRMKGESIAEIIGAARAMRAHGVTVRPAATIVVDTCGTGGDHRGTFNISTAAALIAAGAGVTVAKHGNRAMSGTCGGADVLEALGVKIDLPSERVAACIDSVGIGFLFAQALHPAMRHVAAPRRELGVRTLFNLLGPLSNPAGARHQILGVFAAEWTEPLAYALAQLGSRHALVVHGEDGLDEITLAAATVVSELQDGKVHTYRLTPEEMGLSRCRADDLRGASGAAAAQIVREILDGVPGPRADVALVNAAAALYVSGMAPSMADGLARARTAVADGRARAVLDRFVEVTNR